VYLRLAGGGMPRDPQRAARAWHAPPCRFAR
jgi:hypothetical protein